MSSEHDVANRALVARIQQETDPTVRAKLIAVFINENWGFFKFRYKNYAKDESFLKSTLFILLDKIIHRVDLSNKDAQVMRFLQQSLTHDLARAHRAETSLIQAPVRQSVQDFKVKGHFKKVLEEWKTLDVRCDGLHPFRDTEDAMEE